MNTLRIPKSSYMEDWNGLVACNHSSETAVQFSDLSSIANLYGEKRVDLSLSKSSARSAVLLGRYLQITTYFPGNDTIRKQVTATSGHGVGSKLDACLDRLSAAATALSQLRTH